MAVGPEMGVHWIRAPGELLSQTKQTKSGAKSAMTIENQTTNKHLSLPLLTYQRSWGWWWFGHGLIPLPSRLVPAP